MNQRVMSDNVRCYMVTSTEEKLKEGDRKGLDGCEVENPTLGSHKPHFEVNCEVKM